MWEPNTVMVPTELAVAELRGLVPSGTTLAYADFMMTMMSTLIPKSLTASTPAQKVALQHLKTGEIVTADGEIATVTEAASPASSTPNPATEPQASETTADFDTTVTDAFRAVFPEKPFPTIEQLTTMQELTHGDPQIVVNALTIADNSSKPVTSPGGFVLYLLRSKSADTLHEEAEAIRKANSRNPETIVRRALREADRVMPTLVPPKPNAARLKERKKELGGG